MKKQVAAVVSFSALLTLSAFAPKVFWQENKNVNRLPASVEEAKIEDKKKDVNLVKEEIKIKSEEATVQCLKDKQPTALEAEIKKLMADKEAIMKEIADLKKEVPSADKKDKKEAPRFTEKEEIVSLVSQMTSMMITQQQQQQMLMEQMFSMMTQMQSQMPQNQQQNFMSPYSFNGSYPQATVGYPQAYPAFENSGVGIGIGYGLGTSYSYSQAQAYQNPYAIQADQSQMRAPSAQYEPAFLPRQMSVQPQLQSQYVQGGNFGFDFSKSAIPQDMERVMF